MNDPNYVFGVPRSQLRPRIEEVSHPSHVLTVDTQLRMIVCSACETGVWPTHVFAHMSVMHRFDNRKVVSETLKNLLKELDGIGLVRPSELATLVGVPAGIEGSYCIPDKVDRYKFEQALLHHQFPFRLGRPHTSSTHCLLLYRQARRCVRGDGSCGFVFTTLQMAKEHWRSQHGYSAGDDMAGAHMDDEIASTSIPVLAQRFFRAGPMSHLFEVVEEGPMDWPGYLLADNLRLFFAGSTESVGLQSDCVMEDRLSMMNGAEGAGLWEERTAFHKRFDGYYTYSIMQAAQPLDSISVIGAGRFQQEAAETRLWNAVLGLGQLVNTMLGTLAGSPLTFMAMQLAPESPLSTTPLRHYRRSSDTERIFSIWARLALFVFRTYLGGNALGQTYRLTIEMRDAWEFVEVLLKRPDLDEDGDLLPIHCLAFFIALLSQEPGDSHMDMTICQLFGPLVSSETGFLGPGESNFTLVGLCRSARLLLSYWVVVNNIPSADIGARLNGLSRNLMGRGTFSPFDWLMIWHELAVNIDREEAGPASDDSEVEGELSLQEMA